MTAGFAVFTASPERTRNIAIASFLMVCAGFVKHTIFAMPLAATVWLIGTNRRALAHWVAFSLVFVALGFSASAFAFGSVFFEQLMYRRPMSLYYVIMLLGWFQGFIIPAALWFVFWFRAPPDPRFRLVSYLLIAACIEFVILRSGDLVSINSLFDCVIAASIAAGLMLSRAEESRLFARYGVGATTALIVGVLCLKLILLPQNELMTFVAHPDVLDDLRSRDAASRQDIALMRTYEGPAICENLSLCYWSGHQSAYDSTASSAAFRLGDRDINVLREQIFGGQFRLIQLEPRSPLLDAARNSGLAERKGASGIIIFHAAARAGN
jgi:hypothetical protein